jgi:hypothetical protein
MSEVSHATAIYSTTQPLAEHGGSVNPRTEARHTNGHAADKFTKSTMVLLWEVGGGYSSFDGNAEIGPSYTDRGNARIDTGYLILRPM